MISTDSLNTLVFIKIFLFILYVLIYASVMPSSRAVIFEIAMHSVADCTKLNAVIS